VLLIAASHGPPLAAVCVAAVLSLAVLVPVAVERCGVHRARRMLARCPRCGDHAVRRMDAETVGLTRERVALQCGQCDTWRRAVVGDGYRRTQERRFARDRVHIQRLLTAAERRRRS
jgi:hypothetical protein